MAWEYKFFLWCVAICFVLIKMDNYSKWKSKLDKDLSKQGQEEFKQRKSK